MRYYATASGPKVREAMRQGLLGMIATPASGNVVELGVDWCADNAAFADKYPGDAAFLRWLADRAQHVARCGFVAAPDVVCDAAGTLVRSVPMFEPIRALGYPVALVAQNGLENLAVPWDGFDALFLGGDDAWKLGAHARRLVADARYRGKWVHMGRVNSESRLRYAHAIGCHSADGTYLAHGPDVNLPKLLGWLRRVPHPATPRHRKVVEVATGQAALWEVAA